MLKCWQLVFKEIYEISYLNLAVFPKIALSSIIEKEVGNWTARELFFQSTTVARLISASS